jgi:hypothetical protein
MKQPTQVIRRITDLKGSKWIIGGLLFNDGLGAGAPKL